MDDGTYHVFIVDTDSYSGNFERPMCAFMTGAIGECGVGGEYIDADARDMSEMIVQVADEHGCHRPVAIEATPGYVNDGWGRQVTEAVADQEGWDKPRWPAYQSVAIFFEEALTADDISYLKDRAEQFAKTFKEYDTDFKIIGYRTGSTERIWNLKDC